MEIIKDKNIIDKFKCRIAIKMANALMGNSGRLLIRKSGTEPLIRVMGEHEDFSILQEAINEIVQAIKRLN